MRIAMFLDTDFPPDSRVENEAVSLIEAGHKVFLFSLSYHSFVHQNENENGIEVRRYAAGKLLYKLSALVYTFPFFSFLVKKKIKNFIKSVKPNILHIHDMPLAKAVFDINKKYKLPVVLDLHENRPEIMKHYPHLQKFPGNILISPLKWSKIQIKLIKKANQVILVTQEAKNKLLKLHKELIDKICVVPNTVNPAIFYRYPINKKIIENFETDLMILYVGDTGIRRGTDTAIKAMPLVLEKIPKAKLVLVGCNSDDYMLKKLASDLHISASVIFEGWQDVSLFPSYISASTVCISPLKRNIHHDTTYANKIFQYMSMGKPLIVSNCPAQQHVIENENCGLVYKAENEVDFATKLIKILSDTTLRNTFAINAKKAVDKKWNWDITKKELINFYKSLNTNTSNPF